MNIHRKDKDIEIPSECTTYGFGNTLMLYTVIQDEISDIQLYCVAQTAFLMKEDAQYFESLKKCDPERYERLYNILSSTPCLNLYKNNPT